MTSKVETATKVGWALLAMFGLIGCIIRPDNRSLLVVIVTVLGWTLTRIVHEGYVSTLEIFKDQ